jgi:TM2 domain-containing membrane protein YozV
VVAPKYGQKPTMSRDLRKYAQQTNIRLIAGGLIVLFVVGIGLIYFFYGQGAALTGLLCLFVGLIPLILIWLMFYLLEFITKRANSG